jgi:short-subunit dehydrogenase
MSASSTPVALVTGCSTGIGRATALLFAQSGYRVFATVRTAEAETVLRRSAAGLPLEVLQKDLLEEDAASALVGDVLQREGRIDVLVNNAGYALSGAVEDLPAEEVRLQFQVNVFAPVQLCRVVLPTMRAQRSGHIVNVSSLAGRVSVPLMGAYCASKFALEAFSDALRAEAKPFRIHVAIVEPGPVATEFNRNAVMKSRKVLETPGPYRPAYEEYVSDLGPRRAATPEQAARTILKAARGRRSRYRVRTREAFAAGLIQVIPKGAMDFATIRVMGLHKLGR